MAARTDHRRDLQTLARNCGDKARQRAARLALLLRMYHQQPTRNDFLLIEIATLSRRLVYLMKQSTLIGLQIEHLEARRWRAASQQAKPQQTTSKD